jgi:hypothetical protein
MRNRIRTNVVNLLQQTTNLLICFRDNRNHEFIFFFRGGACLRIRILTVSALQIFLFDHDMHKKEFCYREIYTQQITKMNGIILRRTGIPSVRRIGQLQENSVILTLAEMAHPE